MAKNNDLGKTSCGLQPNVAALLAYLFGWLSGLIFYLIEKENKFVRFHAVQSMAVFGGLFVLSAINTFFGAIIFQWRFSALTSMVAVVLGVVSLVVWIILLIKAYQGEKIKMPIAGDIAEKYS